MAHWLDGIALVDGHHHFWDLTRFPYRWLAPDAPPARFGDKASIRRNFLPDDYLAAFEGLPLTASVHVQANCGAADPVEETRWLQALSDKTGWPSAIVAEVDLTAEGAETQIEGHLQLPALRGIRTPVAWDAAGRWRIANRPAVLTDERLRATLPLLEAHGLCLECVVVPAQLDEVAALARAHPDLSIVLNHFATLEPDQPGNLEDWRKGIEGLHDAANVVVKLSGLWTVDKTWRTKKLRPHVTHLLSCVGADRVLYGSNMPIERVNCPLARQFDQLQDVLEDQPQTTLTAIFSDTARWVYRL
ncbi:putative TIM-barrel fold metal-dependent hydrolase [Primorskyibacter sedentarius]|uniref:Putative TIM-barrel fold metal-dependent hydrolase n=1 Tax=Primorskyibacter sedentarius TaxID=745311 RepID=A0A4R3IPY8_9RHOB|nr:amidohydrolase family protein [Primorskyibacter sedentarius]TCS52480.1 putative TIM-barrel fold metal-dependent hydrolase [Primorskyibacter sedentarius]